MNNDWNCTVGGLLRRIIWLATVLAIAFTLLRLMAWADTGARDIEPESAQPRHQGVINYGPVR